MSLYIIEDDDGNVLTNYGDFDNTMVRAALYDGPLEPAVDIERYGGHVVTLIEEPEKVVLSKEQAKIVERAHDHEYSASYISEYSDEEELLMKAYVNGYTVKKEKEKKYKVRVPKTQTSYYYKGSDGHVHASDTSGGLDNEFSDYELQQYGLDGERFTKEEVTDDEQ